MTGAVLFIAVQGLAASATWLLAGLTARRYPAGSVVYGLVGAVAVGVLCATANGERLTAWWAFATILGQMLTCAVASLLVGAKADARNRRTVWNWWVSGRIAGERFDWSIKAPTMSAALDHTLRYLGDRHPGAQPAEVRLRMDDLQPDDEPEEAKR